jgi:hypothetical protein
MSKSTTEILSFREWLAQEYKTNIEWADNFIKGTAEENTHMGDCTKDPCPCALCGLERVLKEYRLYCEKKGLFNDN